MCLWIGLAIIEAPGLSKFSMDFSWSLATAESWILKGVLKNGPESSAPPGKIAGLTLPKTNIAPENGPSQKETSIPTIHFQGIC